MVGKTLYPMIKKRQPAKKEFGEFFGLTLGTTRKNDKV